MFRVIRLLKIYIFFWFWEDCVNFIVLPLVVYMQPSAMDALVGSVILTVRRDGVRVALDNCFLSNALMLDGR